MATLDLAAVMDAIATQIESAGLTTRAYAWPVESISPPCAVVGYPTEIDFDMTFRRGSDKAIFPIFFLVGKVSDRTARDVLSAIIADSTSIKSALDGTIGGAVSTARVTDVKIEEVNVAGTPYLGAVFQLEVYT